MSFGTFGVERRGLPSFSAKIDPQPRLHEIGRYCIVFEIDEYDRFLLERRTLCPGGTASSLGSRRRFVDEPAPKLFQAFVQEPFLLEALERCHCRIFRPPDQPPPRPFEEAKKEDQTRTQDGRRCRRGNGRRVLGIGTGRGGTGSRDGGLCDAAGCQESREAVPAKKRAGIRPELRNLQIAPMGNERRLGYVDVKVKPRDDQFKIKNKNNNNNNNSKYPRKQASNRTIVVPIGTLRKKNYAKTALHYLYAHLGKTQSFAMSD